MSDMGEQRDGLQRAREQRYEHLVAIEEGVLDPLDILEAAAFDTHLALRRLPVVELFMCLKGGQKTWARVRSRFLRSLDIQDRDLRITVGWVLDPRTGGRRHLALRDAVRPRTEPWPGFPWTPDPNGGPP